MTSLLVFLVVVAALYLLISKQPSDFSVTRTITISAPAAVVFEQVNNLPKWEAWSPWAKLDPSAKSIFEGPLAGTGATMKWAGNNKVGEGSMTITQSTPYDFIRFKLEFLKPFKATNTAEFTFKMQGDQTTVSWSMFGKNNFIGKAMGLIINCHKMVGGQFEKGLSQMKSVAESAAKAI